MCPNVVIVKHPFLFLRLANEKYFVTMLKNFRCNVSIQKIHKKKPSQSSKSNFDINIICFAMPTYLFISP
jgi:hypothetical protein